MYCRQPRKKEESILLYCSRRKTDKTNIRYPHGNSLNILELNSHLFSGFEPHVAQLEAISFCLPPTPPSCLGVVEIEKVPLSLLCSRPNKPSYLSHPSMTDSPDSFSAPLLFPGHASAPQCLSCMAGPRTEPRI